MYGNQIFHTVVESVLRYGCEIRTLDYILKEKLLEHGNGCLVQNCKHVENTGLFEIIVGVLTTCLTQYI